MTQIALAVLIGLAGWAIVAKTGFPAAPMIGPMIFVGAAACLGWVDIALPVWVRLALQMSIGTLAGYRLDQEAARRIGSMGKPLLAVTAWTIGVSLVVGYLLHSFTSLDWPTSFLGTAPGGMPEMTAMALTMQANVAMVATLSSTRMVSSMIIIPFLAKRQGNGVKPAGVGATNPDSPIRESAPGAAYRYCAEIPLAAPVSSPATRGLHWIYCLGIGVAGGSLFYWLQIPAAGVMGSIVAVAGARIGGLKVAALPTWMRTAAQLGMGVFIGTTFTPETATLIASNLLPVLFTAATLVASGLVLSRAVQRTLGLDAQTALLACSPAGVTQMAVLSEELGSQTFIVSVFQLTRMLTVVLVMPFIFRMLIGH